MSSESTDRSVPAVEAVDLVAQAEAGEGIVWKQQSADLNVNLFVLGEGGEIAEHVNTSLDVLLVGVDGEGRVTVDGEVLTVRPGTAAVIPQGARRSIRATGRRFAYVTCHRRRGGLQIGPAVPRG